MKYFNLLNRIRTIATKGSWSELQSITPPVLHDDILAGFFFSEACKNIEPWLSTFSHELTRRIFSKEQTRPLYGYLFELSKTNIENYILYTNQVGGALDYYGFTQTLQISQKLTPPQALSLSPGIMAYLSKPGINSASGLSSYLKHASQATGGTEICLNVISIILSNQASVKNRATTDNAHDGGNEFAIDDQEFNELLTEAIRPLAERAPLLSALLLISALRSSVAAEYNEEPSSSGPQNDISEFWCRTFSEVDDYQDTKANLARCLAYACEQLYNKTPEHISALDGALRGVRWLVFTRLRQYLYSKFPTEKTKPWIRECILTYNNYTDSTFNYEFNQMIRKGCESFGEKLLTETERTSIFDSILSGPSEERARENAGDFFTTEGFQKHRDYFHRKQFQPFASVIFGKYSERYAALSAQVNDTLDDDDYSHVSRGRGGFVSYRSPFPAEELARLKDEELLNQINTWQESKRDSTDFLIEINISALAGAFETVLRQQILPDSARSSFWFGNRERIARPIYIRYMLKALQEDVKAGKYERFDQALDLCGWVLEKPDDPETKDTKTAPHEESSDHPAWRPVRRGVVDFIGACVNKDAITPLTYRGALAALLTTVCIQRDPRLDDNKPTISNRRDPLTDAINNPRGIALENAFDLGFWIRRQKKDDSAPEVAEILERRLQATNRIPLTAAEYALLGRQFGALIALNETWARDHRAVIFPRDKPQAWEDAFGTYLRFNNPYRRPFEILKSDYIYALDQLDAATDEDDNRKGWCQSLGQHLFMFYVWDMFPLTGKKSLLQSYYTKTKDHPKQWAVLFDHAGRLLRNTTEELDQGIKDRLQAFAEWRLRQGNNVELAAYTFWLEGKCLDARWRLETFSKVLEVAPGRHIGTSIKMDALNKLLPEHPALVVECFDKLISGLMPNDVIYIQNKSAEPLLKAGLASADPKVRKHAENAREFLLRAARFEFLDL